VDETIVVQLTSEGLEVASVEVLGQHDLGELVDRVKDEEAASPFDDATLAFEGEHFVEASDKFV